MSRSSSLSSKFYLSSPKLRTGSVDVMSRSVYTAGGFGFERDDVMDAVNKIRKTIRSGKVNIVDMFREADKSKSGQISTVEFKNVLQSLKIGLSSLEINRLVELSDIGSKGYVNWMSFVNRITLK